MKSLTELAAKCGGEEILSALVGEIACIEDELVQQCGSEVNSVHKVNEHTRAAGGKRLRPAFVSLAAQSIGKPYDKDRVRMIGAAMEMIHMATLLHDDVIDHSPLRRGRPTASVVFGTTESVLSGDVLLAKAMVILAEDGDLELIRSVASAVVEIAEGEVLELEKRNVFDLGLEEHIEVLRKKTAAFLRICCQAGAILAGADESSKQALCTYGEKIGLAFQIVDDILDYRGDVNSFGKVKATDFREGCSTVPLIMLLPRLTPEEKLLAQTKFGNGVTDDELAQVSNWMETRGAFDAGMELARDYATQATDALKVLPDSNVKELLKSVSEWIVTRET